MGIYFNQGNMLMYNSKNHSRIYIDKSMLISNLNSLLFGENRYICISRPRRFGKSMAANMLAAYYSRGCDSKELFADLKIAEDSSFEKHLNKYNVISFDMQKFLVKTKSTSQMLEYMEEEVLEELLNEYPDLNKYKRLDLSKAVGKIYESTKIPFVFIIDEWDCVLRYYQNSESGQKEYLDYLYALFKNQPYVALAYMTGILPVKKYGRHSALNMFDEYSMENTGAFSVFTGFTEEETELLCKRYDININNAQKWYNGYNVNHISIYNPHSIVQACQKKVFTSYWTKTETYESLKTPIQLNFHGLKEKVRQMIAGEKIIVNTGKFQNDMTSMKSSDDVLTLLIHLGYLTYDLNTKTCWIPNMEVQQEFINCIEDGGWEETINAIRQSERCLTATISGDEKTVAKIIEQTHQENTSIIKYNDEKSLSCIVTLSYYTARNKYYVIRELPSGKGYADIAFLPRPNEKLPAIVVELKKEQDESIAIEQIKKRQYFESLKSFHGEIILVGINYTSDVNNSEYKKHTCKIERITK